jgi:hypothetical protein
VITADGTEGKAEAQYSCYNFTYWEIVSSPVTAYKNKWPSDWTSFWFYHKVALDDATQSHNLITDKIRNLGDTPRVDVDEMEDRLAFVAMLWEVSKVYGTRDITEEYVACRCWPLKARWSIKAWLLEAQWTRGIPMLDFAASFNLKKHHTSASWCYAPASLLRSIS